MRALPEAGLTFPGSEEIDRGGDGRTETVTGTYGAFAWRVHGTDGGIDELFDWYAKELEASGWISGGGSARAPTTSELRAAAWVRDGLIFRLSVRDPEETSPEWQQDWTYVYRTAVLEDRQDE